MTKSFLHYPGLLLAGLVLSACAADSSSTPDSTSAASAVSGYMYTTLNGEGENGVVRFARLADGTLGEETLFLTGSKGGANRAAGGDAYGDFDSQNAINIIGDYLLAANAGGHEITVFKMDRANGDLTLVSNVPSYGERPVSITSRAIEGEDNKFWVVVGNQWNNPNVQKGGEGEAPIERYPHDAFIADGHTDVDPNRNIALFYFDAEEGELEFETLLDTYAGTNGGPTTVDFSPSGNHLAVATWGISHFGTATPSLDEQQPSRVYVYNFDDDAGDVTNARYYEDAGVAGSIGLDWTPGGEHVLVTNFNLTVEKRDHSVTVLGVTDDAVVLKQNFGTGDGADIDEACWMLVSPDGKFAYASSFGTNVISVFGIDEDGALTTIGDGAETAYASRKEGTPGGDTKDMYIVGDNFYVIGAYQTYTFSHYSINSDGTLELVKEYDVASATEDDGAGTYNFLGLVGFEIEK